MAIEIKDALYVAGLVITGVSTWIAMDRRVTKAESKSESQDGVMEALAETVKGIAGRVSATEFQQGDLRGEVRVLAQRVSGVEQAVRDGFVSVLSEIRNLATGDNTRPPR